MFPYIHQLYRCPLIPDQRIQWQGKQRGEDHIYPTFCSCAHKVSDDFPVVFTEHRNLVIICQTVTVKPFRVDQIQCGQFTRNHMDLHGCLFDDLSLQRLQL